MNQFIVPRPGTLSPKNFTNAVVERRKLIFENKIRSMIYYLKTLQNSLIQLKVLFSLDMIIF